MDVNLNKLKALIGATATAVLLSYVPQFEGVILRGYKDPIGIVTACSGHTKTAILGRPYTKAECNELLVKDLYEHASGVLGCTPELKGHIPQLAAMISFAFNVGVTKYCNSTIAKRVRENDFLAACNGLLEWVYAGGKVMQGLVERRAIERELCLDGLVENTNETL